jgi:hypothetical protein
MLPFFLANSTRAVSCARLAAAPVGLLGEQKKMMSVRGTCGGWTRVRARVKGKVRAKMRARVRKNRRRQGQVQGAAAAGFA